MPTSRGFDYYLGVPYSVDMGNSVWKRQTVPGDNGVLPLVQGTAREGFRIIEQPAAFGLYCLMSEMSFAGPSIQWTGSTRSRQRCARRPTAQSAGESPLLGECRTARSGVPPVGCRC
jgi:hypothetical protein